MKSDDVARALRETQPRASPGNLVSNPLHPPLTPIGHGPLRAQARDTRDGGAHWLGCGSACADSPGAAPRSVQAGSRRSAAGGALRGEAWRSGSLGTLMGALPYVFSHVVGRPAVEGLCGSALFQSEVDGDR